MNRREQIIEDYFKSWIDNDMSFIQEYFHNDIIYIESWGPAYNGIDSLKKWFYNWHIESKVLVWDVKEIYEVNNKVICEWYFKYEDKKSVEDFNGISIFKFSSDNKIVEVKEFMSVLPLRYPYE